jgi:2-hydroxy-3-oxopropionate reductase
MSKPVLGFIGLGIMGRPMVRNLLAHGYAVHVYSLQQADIDDVTKDGAIGAECGREVAKNADVIITMVPDTPHVEEALFGPDGVAEAGLDGKVVIDMSTISSLATREFARRIAALGGAMLDAPVSGGDKGAAGGSLSIMVGGDPEVYERCLPILEILGSRVIHVGGNGAGQVVKSCNQILAAATVAALGEALVMGTKAGVDPAKIVEVLSAGYARCGALEIRGAAILARDFTPGFKSKLQLKDLRLAAELAQGIGVPMPVLALVQELYKAAQVVSSGEEDHTNVMKVTERLAGVEVRASAQ